MISGKFNNKWMLLGVILALSVFLDQLSKYLVQNFMQPYQSIDVIGQTLRLTFITNKGAAFGLQPHRLVPFVPPTLFFSFFNLLAGGLVLWLYWKTPVEDRWVRAGLGLILGGAAGNFIDRLRWGQVIDFIDVDLPDIIMERWPVFNVADSAVTVGIAIIIVLSLCKNKKKTEK